MTRRSLIPRRLATFRSWLVLAALLFGSVLAFAPATAGAAVTVVSCAPFGTDDLQAKIDAAASGDTLLIKGTCTGGFNATHDVTLQGAGQGATLSGAGAAKVLTVYGPAVTLKNLTLTAGSGDVGAAIDIRDGANVSVVDSDLRGNTARVAGGGVYIENSTLHVVDSVVEQNTATYKGAGIASFFATVTVSGSRLIGNTTLNTDGDGNGAGIELYSSTGTLTDSFVSGNSAGSSGGGIDTENGTNVTLTGTTVSGNTAPAGGGIENGGQSMTLTNSSVDHNTLELLPGRRHLQRLGLRRHTLVINNSIVAFNRSLAAGGAPFGGGGGIFNFAESGNTASVVATHMLLTGNSAPQGEGGGLDNENLDGRAAVVSISQSIIGSLTGASPKRPCSAAASTTTAAPARPASHSARAHSSSETKQRRTAAASSIRAPTLSSRSTPAPSCCSTAPTTSAAAPEVRELRGWAARLRSSHRLRPSSSPTRDLFTPPPGSHARADPSPRSATTRT